VVLAARIRDILFRVDRGGTWPLGPVIALETILGLIALFWGYVASLRYVLPWDAILTWSLTDWGLFAWRFACVMMVIAFLYPWGRFIAGKWAGIRFEGMCLDQYYEPTLKIDYVTFLETTPPKRKWFFFFAGFWTVLTSAALSVIGIILGQDYTALNPTVLLLIFEGYVVATGMSKATGGEMGHYNREKKIERAWKKKIEKEREHPDATG